VQWLKQWTLTWWNWFSFSCCSCESVSGGGKDVRPQLLPCSRRVTLYTWQYVSRPKCTTLTRCLLCFTCQLSWVDFLGSLMVCRVRWVYWHCWWTMVMGIPLIAGKNFLSNSSRGCVVGHVETVNNIWWAWIFHSLNKTTVVMVTFKRFVFKQRLCVTRCSEISWSVALIAFSALMLLVWQQEGSKKIEWCDAGVVICLKRGANDLHMVQLMPLPSCHLLLP